MDPVTAFSLAAGVLQVIDLGFKASSMCKEIYTDGSLAQHRDAAELTTFLAESTERLERSMQSTSRPVSEETRDVIEVSKKCSAIAKELLAELRKLQSEPGDNLLQAIKKGTRAVRRRGAIKEIEKRLRKYQDILKTRILTKLDAHAVQQHENFETLDQNVKDLAIQLSQSHKIFAQSLNKQSVALRTQLDRRIDDHVHTQAIENLKQQFKDSLFFPEMFARQDEIAKSHEGTCRWIFDPPQVNPSDGSSGKDPNSAPRVWDNFSTWLGTDEDIYWLSGKPGSGKSTLMRYISSEFRNSGHSKATLPGFGTGVDLVTCSFFFWTLGSSLQKNYVGFLRSLLYQIAEQREDLIPLMVSQDLMPDGKMSHSHEPIRILAWTKERLDYSLKRFLSSKPSAISVCLFIDGLDEFVGDEDMLLETLRLLSGTPRTHVCVSSRPEQIFRQGFAQSPRLRLQDLNHRDIQNTVKDRLGATLAEKFPYSPKMVDKLVTDVIFRSEGIFLWTELIIKDLQRGARNSDTLQELRERFARMPNTIEGLYQHMLDQLDRSYLQEAAKYFQLLMVTAEMEDLEVEWSNSTELTLLDCACAEEMAWSRVLSHDTTYFQSPEFHASCRNLETRILTRCTGLVEVSEHQIKKIRELRNVAGGHERVHVRHEASTVSCFLRAIQFIHKTVIEFLLNHEEFFQDPDWRISAGYTLTRGRLGVVSLMPILLSERDATSGSIKLKPEFVMDLVARLSRIETLWPRRSSCQEPRDITMQVVTETYDILGYVNESLNGSGRSLYDFVDIDSLDKPPSHIPFDDYVGFAAYFGQHEYISTYLAQTDRSLRDVDYVFLCGSSGLWPFIVGYEIGPLEFALAVQGYCKSVVDILKCLGNPVLYLKTDAPAKREIWNSKWVVFLDCSFQILDRMYRGTSGTQISKADVQYRQQIRQSLVLWKNAIAYFLDHDADVNITCYGSLWVGCSDPYDSKNIAISFMASETLLACIGRTFPHIDPEIRKEVEQLARSHGGQHRRTILSIKLDKEVYALTQEQSDRLLHAWAWEDGSLPETYPLVWSVHGICNGEEPQLVPSASPDPETERVLRILLDNIDRFRVTKDFVDNHPRNWYTNLDFGTQ